MTNTETKPKSPKAPADRKPKAEDILDAELAKDELLADLPDLKPPHRLRLREKNRITTILIDSGLLDDDGSDEEEEFDYRNPDHRAKIKDLLEIGAAIDEFAESIALDKPAYIAWSEQHSDNVEVFLAILQRYTSAAGESDGSAS